MIDGGRLIANVVEPSVTGHPDTQLVSYGEMMDSARQVGEALREIPCIGDGDTGYGNAVNVKRTVKGYAQVRLIQ